MDIIDCLIVGAGTAGCVLAARLSQDASRRVVLLEAGPDFPGEDTLPAALHQGNGEGYDWGLRAAVTAGRVERLARGKVVGGSSQVNALGAVRAVAGDFRSWADRGLPAWGWDRVLESYRRIETDLEYGDRPYHGDGGPVPITRWPQQQWTAPMSGLLEAMLDTGHPYCPDMNAPDAVGVGPYPHNRRGRVRMSTALTHLAPARARENLTIRAGLTVERVVVRDGRAVGVEASGEVIPAREVILAAGTPLTPTLLLRSGIGPAAELRRVGVPSVVDLPGVGRGLYDQPGAVIPASPVPGAVPAGAPMTQLIARLAQIPGHPVDEAFYLCPFAGPAPGGSQPLITIMIGDMNPGSRGTITLTGPSPSQPPHVDLAFYTADGDLERIRAAYRHAWSMAQHPAFTKTISQFVMVSDDIVASDERLDELLRGMTFSRLTLLGGAAMGPESDPLAVTGQDCRVRGIEGLRVVDLSIVPVPLRSPTALDAMMIGDHAADLIVAGG